MKTYRLESTPDRDLHCRRTVEFSETHTLKDVHRTIQSEFEPGDRERLWAFFLSGELFDPATEFGIGELARPPTVRLGQLEDLEEASGLELPLYIADALRGLRGDGAAEAEALEWRYEPGAGPRGRWHLRTDGAQAGPQ